MLLGFLSDDEYACGLGIFEVKSVRNSARYRVRSNFEPPNRVKRLVPYAHVYKLADELSGFRVRQGLLTVDVIVAIDARSEMKNWLVALLERSLSKELK
jgi:hypothetical protein